MPKLSQEMNEKFNHQIKVELESAYIYLALSKWFSSKNLEHLTIFFDLQAKEEYVHAEKLMNFVEETDGALSFSELKAPKNDYASVEEAINAVLAHEEYVSREIHKLYEFAEENKEYVAVPILRWFIEEQIEEEDTARKLVALRAYINNDYYFDHRIKSINAEKLLSKAEN